MVVFLDYEVRRVAQAKQKSNSRDGQALERDWKKQLRKLRYGWMIGNWMGREGKGKEKGKGGGSMGTGGFVEVLCCVIRVEFLSSVIEILLSQKKQHCYVC